VPRKIHTEIDDDDRLLWGGRAIGAAAEIFKADGTVNAAKTFRLLRAKLIKAKRVGRQYVSTRRQVRSIAQVGDRQPHRREVAS